MADLQPNTAKVEKKGTNVRLPLLISGDRYHLTLCPNLAGTGAVLLIKMTVQFQFEDGTSEKAATKGQKLTWTKTDKETFASGFVTAIKDAWDDKYKLVTDSKLLVAPYREVRVEFRFKTIIDGWDISDDFELSVTKIDTARGSSDTNPLVNNATLNSEDLTPWKFKDGNIQRGAVHEFGHMIGLRDEYPAAAWYTRPNTNWKTDLPSVMHHGETIRPRHYAPFAGWLTDQYSGVAVRGQSPVVFKVDDGSGILWDMGNSGL